MKKSWAVCALLLLLPLVVAAIGRDISVGPTDEGFPDPAFPDPAFPDPGFPDLNGNSTFVPDSAKDGYCQMMLLSTVPMPPSDIPWDCICSHCQGTKGPKGERGDRGMTGRPGSPGPRGSPGSRGAPGFVGRPGIKGQKGDDGVKGALGLQGLMGPKGGMGYKGEKGEAGLEGPAGDQGPKGDDGLCPDECEASQGPPGPPGPPGPAGIRGSLGADGPKGQKGAPGVGGEPGVPGTDGVPGVKGDQGPEGDCPCTDGEDGAPGEKGDEGDQGVAGEPGPKGDQGPEGEKGDEGMPGMPGLPGPCMPMIKSAFSAALSQSFPSPSAPVPFSTVYYNMHNNFIPSMGIYVAPVNGTYVLSFSLTVFERPLIVGLIHNFNVVLVATGTTSLSTVAHTVVLHLGEGDGIWLQTKSTASNGVYSSDETSSLFSGYLLYPDRCEGLTPDIGFPVGRGDGEGFDLDKIPVGNQYATAAPPDPSVPPTINPEKFLNGPFDEVFEGYTP